jgi:hypothetical protein
MPLSVTDISISLKPFRVSLTPLTSTTILSYGLENLIALLSRLIRIY